MQGAANHARQYRLPPCPSRSTSCLPPVGVRRANRPTFSHVSDRSIPPRRGRYSSLARSQRCQRGGRARPRSPRPPCGAAVAPEDRTACCRVFADCRNSQRHSITPFCQDWKHSNGGDARVGSLAGEADRPGDQLQASPARGLLIRAQRRVASGGVDVHACCSRPTQRASAWSRRSSTERDRGPRARGAFPRARTRPRDLRRPLAPTGHPGASTVAPRSAAGGCHTATGRYSRVLGCCSSRPTARSVFT
jgi:hypothetical protein